MKHHYVIAGRPGRLAGLTFSLIIAGLVSLFHFSVHGNTLYDASSANHITQEKLTPLLISKPRGPGQPISNRAWWNKVAAKCSKQKFDYEIRKVKQMQSKYKPDFSDQAWLDRKGPNKYAQSMIATIDLIERMMVVECLEDKGRYLPDLISLVDRLCQLKTWITHYHDKDAYAFSGKGRFCELTSTRIGKLLAMVDYLLGDKLPTATRTAIRAKVREWLFEPYLASLAQGKPVKGMGWISAGNNWNVSCHSQLCYAAGILLDSKEERAKIFSSAIRHVQKYLKNITPDGYCTEGMSYWGYGFGRYVEFAELIYYQTKGKVDLLNGSDKIRNLESYGLNMDMSDQRFPAFADCPTNVRYDLYMASVLNARSRIPGYWKYAYASKESKLPFWSIVYLVQAAELLDSAVPLRPLKNDKYSYGHYFKNGGVVISRPGPEDQTNFSLGLKAGHNREYHNHNDIGSFTVDYKGVFVLCDPGYPVYTWTSFTAKRYDSDAVNSFGHPVPVVNGKLEGNGDVWFKERYWGTITKCEITPAKTVVVIDMKNAYPASCGAKLIKRTFIHERDARKITVIDEAELKQPGTFGTALLSYGKFEKLAPGHFKVTASGVSLNLRISGSPGKLKYLESKLKAKFLKRNAPTRFFIEFEQKSTKFRIETVITPNP